MNPRLLACLFALPVCVSQASAAEGARVFSMDKNYSPVIRLDLLPNQSEAMKAILAMYALQNGAGCEGRDLNGGLKCALTETLGLGTNCSQAHFSLVRKWFPESPKLTSRWQERWNKDASKEGALENLCYGQPDTASWQNKWTAIQVKATGSRVFVSANMSWGSAYGTGNARYDTEYEIIGSHVKVVSSRSKTLCESPVPITGPADKSTSRGC